MWNLIFFLCSGFIESVKICGVACFIEWFRDLCFLGDVVKLYVS